ISVGSMAALVCSWWMAACMSVACEKESLVSAVPSSAFRLTERGTRRRKRILSNCVSDYSAVRNLVTSCFDLGPCDEFCKYSRSADFLFGFGSSDAGVHRRNRRPLRTSAILVAAIPVNPSREDSSKKQRPTEKRRVVVTGMGVETPLGGDPDVFYDSLLEGVSGISQIEGFDCSSFPTRIAGEIKSFSTDGWVAPKLLKRLDKFMLYILTAGKKALADAGIDEDVMKEIDKTRCGVLIGSAMGGMKVFNDGIEALRISHKKMNPFSVPFSTTNMGSAILAMDLGWMGPNYSISTACATSNFCILNAANHIIRGE
ncbi:hypothetical protein M569_13573, partial [Genlisea aurea]